MSKRPRLHIVLILLIVSCPVIVWAQSITESRASQAFDEAVKLHGEGSPTSLQQAVKKYEEAIKLWAGTRRPRGRSDVGGLGMFTVGRESFQSLKISLNVGLRILEKAHGPDSTMLGPAKENYARMLREEGRPGEAEKIQKRILGLSRN